MLAGTFNSSRQTGLQMRAWMHDLELRLGDLDAAEQQTVSCCEGNGPEREKDYSTDYFASLSS